MAAGNVGAGADGQHAPIAHWFYWSWNANSGDTGQTSKMIYSIFTYIIYECLLVFIIHLSGYV